jgi:prolipoprotein diacylglyceryltransferase
MGAKGFIGGWLTTGQLLSLPLLIAGVWLIVWARRAGLPEAGRTDSGDKA